MILRIKKSERDALLRACGNLHEGLVIVPDGTSEEMVYAVFDKVSPERAWYICKEHCRIVQEEEDYQCRESSLFDFFKINVQP